MLVEAILMSVPLVLCVIFIKDKPKYPPNGSAAVKKHDFWKSIKSLLKNKKYLIDMICFSFCLGNSWSILTGSFYFFIFFILIFNKYENSFECFFG